uniref:Uncharacterized protein n=1 Tax=Graphocephala atropunctata TaxID=36148 RepID=A0A1B6KDS7_9HEMI
MPTRKGKKQTERVPFVITSKQWKALNEEKQEKKATEEREKAERKRKREEKKLAKEQAVLGLQKTAKTINPCIKVQNSKKKQSLPKNSQLHKPNINSERCRST